jgi:hypothetical protein
MIQQNTWTTQEPLNLFESITIIQYFIQRRSKWKLIDIITKNISILTFHVILFITHPKRYETNLYDTNLYTFQNKSTAQTGTTLGVLALNSRLLAESQFASGRPCDQPIPSRFSVAFVVPWAKVELVSEFHGVKCMLHMHQNFALVQPSQC